MAPAHARPRYPRTAVPAAALPDLSTRDTRGRLSPAALRGFFSIMDRWQVRDDVAR
jgi:hypothetical protein